MPGLSRRRANVDIWPGFVDALATLLMVIIFLLMVFVIAQFYLGAELTGRDQALDRLNREVAELADLLALETKANTDLRSSVSQLSAELQSTLSERDEFAAEISSLRGLRDSLTTRLAALQDRMDESAAERNRIAAAMVVAETLLAEREADLADRTATLEETLALLVRREAELETAGTSLSEREATLEETLILLARRDADLETTNTVLSERELALAATESALAKAQADLEKRRDELAETLALLARRDAELETSDTVVSERELALAAAEAALAKLQADLDERRKALEEAARKIAVTTAALTRSEQMLANSAAELTRRMKELEEANKTIETDRESIELQLKELAELRQDIVAMVAFREELEKQLREMIAKTRTGDETLMAEREISAAAKAQLALLNRQIAELRRQIATLNEVLETSEARDREQKTQIADLGKRLNAALAAKVQELSRYRSEFFGRLRDVLGDRKDIRIVGDRFVFQSEVLFASGSAEIEQAGKEQMAALARTLLDISRRIPEEIDWVLRVDGHTDDRPIHTTQFPSNWELSTARAISVVRFLQAQGIPPERLAATGFAEYQPLDDSGTLLAAGRNRRIELKLTQR